MAHVLNILAGFSTINLASNGCALLAYVPKAPTSLDEDATVVETVKIEISGASVSAVQAILQSINAAFRLAELFQEKKITNGIVGGIVYASFLPDGYSDTYRSEILTGRLDWDAKALDDQWVEKKIDATITWTRRYYWEGPEISLTLTNGSGSGTSRTIYNHQDSGHDNWVRIEAAAVTGDLPTPPIINLNNNYASGDVLDVYLSHNYLSSPQYLSNTIEAENATGGTPTADGACSNGNYNSVSWTATTETQLLSFTLGDADTEYALGNLFKIMMRFQTAPAYTNCWIRWKFLFGSRVVWSGPLLLLNTKALQDTGIVQWPPGGDLPENMAGLSLNLYAKRNTAGTHNLKIDYIQLMCMDGFRIYRGSVPIDQGDHLVDDGVKQVVYKTSQGNLGYHTHNVIGQSVMLRPGYVQKIHVLELESTGVAPIARTFSVQVSYRPRRVTL